MRFILTAAVLVAFVVGMVSAQNDGSFVERSPYKTSPYSQQNIEATWDLQLSFNLETTTGALGNAGAEFDGTYYYTTRWASNLIEKMDASGNFVEEFSVPGVSGLRDLAFDGTYMYGGAASTTIYMMDFATQTLLGTISSPVNVRNIAYDADNDAFWVGDWATDLVLIDRNGTTLATIPNANLGFVSQYGTAYDNYSAGGPFLWVFDQGALGDQAIVHQVDIASGTLTGVSHDVGADFSASAGVSGGLFITTDAVAGTVSLGGVLQGTPDMFFVYELAPYGDLLDPLPPTGFTATSNAMTPTSIQLDWTDPTQYVNGTALTNFTIEISRDGSFLASVPMGTETYTDNGLTQYQEYSYEVWAKDNVDSTSSHVSAMMAAGGYPPIMVVAPTSLSDTMLVGGTNSHQITIFNNQTNPGPLNYTITENPSASWVTVSSYSGTVGPNSGQVLDVDIDAGGLTPGVYTTELLVAGDDPFNPEDTVTVTLVANAAPIVGFSPDSMSFTLDPTGVQAAVEDSMLLTITNTGQGPLTFELTDEDVSKTAKDNVSVDRSYIRPEYNVEIPKGSADWRHGITPIDGAGGPDMFGYKWIDSDEPGGPTFSWIDISSTGTLVTGLSDDNYVGPFQFGFDFNFYGIDYSQFFIQSNGLISFDDSYISLANTQLPNVDTYNNLLAWFWDDLNASTGGSVYYQNMGDKMVVQFVDYPEYSGPGVTNAEVIMYSNGTILYQYLNFLNGMVLNESTVGIENSDGTDGLQVVFNAPYLHDNLAIRFATESSWLSENPTSGTVPTGGSMDVWVKANSTGLNGGYYSAKVNIHSNDPVTPDTSMVVNATVLGTPQILVDPMTLQFDTLFVGASQTLQVTVSDVGSFPLDVTDITTNNADFTVDTTSFTVGVGATQVVNVTFHPTSAASYTSTMSIVSSDPQTPTTTVELRATSIEAPQILIAPDSLHFDLFSNETDSTVFTISNTGSTPLHFTITDEDVSMTKFQRKVDRSYLRPEFQVPLAKGQSEWRHGVSPIDGAGGPDQFGYKWIDSDEPGGPTFDWIDISGTGTVVTGLTDDSYVGPIPLGFTFSYYGIDYTEFYIASNGFVGFGPPNSYTSLSNVQIPTSTDPNNILPWMWDDLNPSMGGTVYYQSLADRFVVQFVDYPEYNGPGTVTAEVILFHNGAIMYQYLEFLGGMILNECTVGIENETGTDGLQVVFDAAYLHDALAVKFSSESSWLSENPMAGSIPAGGSMDIQAIVNTTAMLGGDYLADVIISSNDPVNPEVHFPRVSLSVTGIPDISTFPDTLVFDSTFVGLTPSLDWSIDNVGTDVLDITSITSTNSVFTVDTSSLTLGPLSGTTVAVTFTPLTPGVYDGMLIVASNDPDTPLDTTYVTAVGLEAPVAVVTPSFTNPVQVMEGDSVEHSINIANAGGSNLNWSCTTSMTMVTRRPVKTIVGPTEHSQNAEYKPAGGSTTPGVVYDAIWDVQFSANLETLTGALGNAGAEFDGTYYYVTRWASNLIEKFDMSGNFVEEFSIPGVSGLRDLAFDGTYMYGGAAANTIYMMDFVTKTLIGSISSPVAVRNIAYDSGNNGLWVGDWDTDLVLIDMSGATLSSIPAATHGMVAMYGSAYDDYSAGGPYLWVFNQDNVNGGLPQNIHQIDLNTLTPTGVVHDVWTDFQQAGATAIAGGLFISEGIVSGKASIGGVLQGTPDYFFVYELADAAPPWLKVMPPTSGSVAPGDNADQLLRIYGTTERTLDTMYVVFLTNDPMAEVVNIEVVRDLITGIGGQEQLPTTFAVSQNYPNPFNPTTTIKYQLPKASDVNLVIYNVLGQKVRTLLNKKIDAGYHEMVWDGLNDIGAQVATGIYIYRFEAGDFKQVKKMILMK